MEGYRFKKGTRVKSPIETVMFEIERATIDGSVDIKQIVSNSEPKDAPLHCEFEWNNRIAGAKWRLEQARKLVQSIEYVPANSPPVRKYHSVEMVVTKNKREIKQVRAFRSIDSIMACPDLRAEILLQAIREVHALRKKYAALQELSQVWAALDKTIQEMPV